MAELNCVFLTESQQMKEFAQPTHITVPTIPGNITVSNTKTCYGNLY